MNLLLVTHPDEFTSFESQPTLFVRDPDGSVRSSAYLYFSDRVEVSLGYAFSASRARAKMKKTEEQLAIGDMGYDTARFLAALMLGGTPAYQGLVAQGSEQSLNPYSEDVTDVLNAVYADALQQYLAAREEINTHPGTMDALEEEVFWATEQVFGFYESENQKPMSREAQAMFMRLFGDDVLMNTNVTTIVAHPRFLTLKQAEKAR